MFSGFYNFSWFLFLAIKPSLYHWIPKLKARDKALEEFTIDSFTRGKKNIWIHCASSGEYFQAAPLINYFHDKYPEWKFAVSFYSPSGIYFPKEKMEHIFYFMLPYDHRISIQQIIKKLQPDITWIMRYDIWYNMLCVLNEHHIPVYIFNAIVTKKHWLRKIIGRPYRKQLAQCTGVTSYHPDTLRFYQTLQVPTMKCGNTRINHIVETTQKIRIPEPFENWQHKSETIIFASVHRTDLPVLSSWTDDGYRIVVPHDLNESLIEEIMTLWPEAKRLSQLQPGECADDTCCIIVDKIGLLRSLYPLAHRAYIGGGYDQGVHNVWEALAAGCTVCCGPRIERFPDVVQLAADNIITVLEAPHFISQIMDKPKNHRSRLDAYKADLLALETWLFEKKVP